MTSIWNTDYTKGITDVEGPTPQPTPLNRTALVQVSSMNSYNNNFFYYRLRSCDTNLTSSTPSAQYQKQKIIQKTVRVDSSQYTMNLASLAGYQNPNKRNAYVPWNQMSDRAEPAKQKANPNGGNTIGGNSTKRSITRLRPGSMSPGGVGCDIKHNSYERYLNRLKGRAPLRRGVIPPNFGVEIIPFNRAFPVYGDKVMKTSIVSGCNCPITTKKNEYKKIYQNNPNQNYNFNIPYNFFVGQQIIVIVDGLQEFAVITEDLGNGNFIVQFSNGDKIVSNKNNFIIYNKCNGAPGVKFSNNSMNPGGSFVDQYKGPNNVVACQKLNGVISNIKTDMVFFPELNDSIPTNGTIPNIQIFRDDGIRYTNGMPIQVNL